ncbi:choice-of-anchor J domain-containing protein [Soonwooa sp.]|uniref:T9SS-dependent choice-of-anchor J family protein n=1 Tax=Soonwooa sp. TaxID=1938592 RepID=UPI0026126E6E|nr:choice-of-anchor J domain-containing protein [Soonwooa sp.]
MTKNLLKLAFCALPLLGYSQIFQEDFDGNGPGISAWTVIHASGNTPASPVSHINGWSVADRSGPDGEFQEPPGNNAAMSTSWFNPVGVANEWLISPSVAISGSKPTLVWQAKAEDPQFPDGYKVMLSPNGGNTIADFTIELFSKSSENASWTTRNADLSAYLGKNIRFAFVNNSDDKYILAVDNVKVVNDFVPPVLPNCVNLLTPTNNQNNIPTSNNSFSWTASPSSQNVSAYNLYLGTSATDLQFIGYTTGTATSLTNLEYNKTYYWSVRPINDAGEATGCTVQSFKTETSPFNPYCGPLTFDFVIFGIPLSGIEPITYVELADMVNTSSDELGAGSAHEAFLNKVAHVKAGDSYKIKLGGNTGGDYPNKFVVFFDWNQNGKLDDAGEVYVINDDLINSTGTDGITITQNIVVPPTALPGNTRMRVKKIINDTASDGEDMPNLTNPCIGGRFGQAEDYTVNVGSLAVNDVQKNKASIYPNPIKDIASINANSKIENIKVFDLSGKLISSEDPNSNKTELNLSKLKSGNYIISLKTESGVENIKVIKK